MIDLKALTDIPPWEWPRNTAARLHQALTDAAATNSDRLVAAGLAGNCTVMNDQLAEDLLRIANHAGEPEELRAQAAISFGPVLETADMSEFDDPEEVPVTEKMFHKIQRSLQNIYSDTNVPKLVRRRTLEAAVRAPEDWHRAAVGTAYASGDQDWKLTAVFAMRFIRGFDDQILEALKNTDAEIHFQAVMAAGSWGIKAAWPHVLGLIREPDTGKDLLIAAIEAAGSIRPQEAVEIIGGLIDSEDEDIADAASEAMAMARGELATDEDDEEFDEDEDDEEGDWVN